MQLLVGIPTHKRPELLRKCLRSIAAQTGELPSTSVFVADNDPNARQGVGVVQEMAAEYPYPISSTVVAEPGISAVRNAILAEARRTGADFLAMIDDDEIASEQWLAKLLEVQETYKADVVGGPVSRDTPLTAPVWMREGIFRVQDHKTGPISLVDATGNVLMSCRALDGARWPQFDPIYGLTGGGDKEYFLRLRNLGFRFVWSPDAKVDEPVPATRFTTGWYIRRQFRYGNIGRQLDRTYGPGNGPSLLWAVTNLAASPLLAVIALHPRGRLKALRRLAYSAGIIGSALGYRYYEYVERHGQLPSTQRRA